MITYPFAVKYLQVSSTVNMAYCDEGSGQDTLLFIHGLANYIPVFQYNIPALSKRYRCVGVDLPGNGLSSKEPYPFTLKFYAEQIIAFIEKAQLGKVTLVGHSMGGHISMMVALRRPDLVDKLILLAPSGLELFSEMEKLWFKSILQLGSFMYSDAMSLETVINQSYYNKERLGAKKIIGDLKELMQLHTGNYWRNMVKTNIESMLDEQVFPFLHLIQQPVLLVMGEQDLLIPNRVIHLTDNPKQVGMRAASRIKTCRLELLPHCGHFVQIEEAEKVNQLAMDFLA